MIRYIFLLSTGVVVAGLFVLVLLLPNDPQSLASNEMKQESNSFVITNVEVFDGVDSLGKQSVRVTDGKIVEISASLNLNEDELMISGDGKTLIPSFIDAHTHTYGNGLADALRFGVSTHLDMFTSEEGLLDTRIARDDMSKTTKADLFSSGTMATVEGGHGTQFGFSIDTIDSIEEVPEWVERRKLAGSDYIKLVYMPYQNYMPSLNRETAKAVIEQAKQQNMLVMAHISTQAAAKDMVEDGVDGLVHIFADSLVSDDLLELAKQNDIFISPTLAVVASADGRGLGGVLMKNNSLAEKLSPQQKSTLSAGFGFHGHGFDFDLAKQNVAKFHQAGVTILAGSDAPNPGTAYGISAHHELQLLVEAGLSETEALVAITSTPAQVFNLSGRGKLEVGARADFILLSGNPLSDITQTLNMYKIFKNGFEVSQSLANSSFTGAKAETNLLGDFESENALSSLTDFNWGHTDDSMANGKSTASIEVLEYDEVYSKVLLVKTTVNSGFPFPWAGAAVGDFELPIGGVDISAYKELVFDIKGTPSTYRVMAFDASAAGVPPSVNFQANKQWQTIRVPLTELKGFSPKVFSGFAIVAGPQPGQYEFMLDNVRVE